ncbi:MAG: DUF559 domain-containing protein [Chloroflexi bacterium]|nr:DUF559 domain-containing protein [Chloroflexota bacterium]
MGGCKFRRQHPIGRFIVDFYGSSKQMTGKRFGLGKENSAAKLFSGDRMGACPPANE